MRQALLDYQKLLLKWNKAINLIGKSTISNCWSRHIEDSLQLFNHIDNKNQHILDVGSGAGLPGMVLSIAGAKSVTLIESDSRKVSFLKEASKLSDNEVTILNQRVEQIEGLECDILTARAFAKIGDLLDMTQHIRVKNKYLLLKGKNFMQEIKDAQKERLFNINYYDSITSWDGKIIEITK